MLDFFVESARRAILFARYEAAHRGSAEIVPEHLLLGLFRDGVSWENVVIDEVSAKKIREEILAYLRQEEKQSSPAILPLSPDSQKVLAAAKEEADRLAHRHVRNQHILLGLMRVEDCFAAKVLRRNGLRVDSLREQISIAPEERPAPPIAGEVVTDTSPAERRLYELDKRVLELFQLNDYQAAMKLVDDTIADPSFNRTQTIRRLAPIASNIAQAMGDLDSFRRYCELRLTCDPGDAMALYKLADCVALQGKINEANKIARKSYEVTLTRSDVEHKGLVEVIEKRFPAITGADRRTCDYRR